MQLVSRKNFMLFLAAILVVALGYMAMSLLPSPTVQLPSYESEIREIESQSQSDSVNDIEKDLMETDVSELDTELEDIENELNQSY